MLLKLNSEISDEKVREELKCNAEEFGITLDFEDNLICSFSRVAHKDDFFLESLIMDCTNKPTINEFTVGIFFMISQYKEQYTDDFINCLKEFAYDLGGHEVELDTEKG